MKKEIPLNRRLFALDCSFALHQRLCWLICALATVAGALAILRFSPDHLSIYFTVTLAILIMLIYQYLARAPMRAMKGWMTLRAQGGAASRAALGYILRLEKALPSMKKKEMAYSLACCKGVLLFETGRKKEALDLLANFQKTWDESQREHIRMLIQQMQDLMEKSTHGEEE